MGFYDAIRVGAAGAADSAYTVDRSLRFNGQYETNAQQFRRTGTSTVSTYTISMWAKNCGVGTGVYRLLFSIGQENDANAGWVGMADGDHLYFQGGNGTYSTSTEKFRDPSAWFHFLISVNSNNFTVYINGTSIKTGTIRSLDTSTNGIRIGVNYGNYYPWDGYIADYYLIDGQALTPSSFTETNAETGQLVPKLYTGSFGTEGAHLTFEDNSGITATTLGKDSSGNGNNYTPSGDWSVSAGIGNDSVTDTPTNNFCTLNILDRSGNSPSNGNLQGGTANTSGWRHTRSTFALPSTGKWYWEYKIPTSATDGSNGWITGIAYSNLGLTQDINSDSTGLYGRQTQGKYNNSSSSPVTNSHFTTVSDNDILQFAYDADGQKLYTGKNNTWELSADPSAGSNPNWTSVASGGFPMAGSYGSNRYVVLNFGQQGFTYTPPTGYKALSSANLPDPTILLPNEHFDTLLWTGNSSSGGSGVTQTISGLNFAPDWVWIKNRSHSNVHTLHDAVRGVNKQLYSASSDAETSYPGRLQAFNSNGYQLGADGDVNFNNYTYVGWNWNAGNTDGKTYTVKVVSDSGNKYRFDNFGTSAVTLDLAEGGTYIFNMDDSSNASHPFSIGTAANGTVYTSGITYFLDGVSKTYNEYTSGFSAASTRRLHITVPASAPQLYYWCSVHSGMGGAINTNSTLGSSNFDGSTQSTAKVNASAGFSIVTYTGTGSLTTLGHGLGAAPQVVITKPRSATGSWGFLHTVGDPSAENRIHLNDDGGYIGYQGYKLWGDTVPTSSVFTVREDASTNASSVTYVAYVFSEVAGYSKFGKYKGNGSSEGPFVFCGFKPALVIIKRTDTSGYWVIHDSKRDPINPNDEDLYANTTGSAVTTVRHDFLSNGFKLRTSTVYVNANNSPYLYLAFAESPFKNARAR